MGRDPVKAARRIAAKPTLAEMRRQGSKLPNPLPKLMAYLVKHLFDEELTATAAWMALGRNDHTLSEAFRDATGLPLAKFIERRRLEIAHHMMRLNPEIEPALISQAMGYRYHGTFVRGYKKVFRMTPFQARRHSQRQAIDSLEVQRGLRGEMDPEAAWSFHQTWLRLYPSVEERLREHYQRAVGQGRIEIGSARKERWLAEGVWQELRGLPFEEQKQMLGGLRFHSTALFDLLRKTSREEGRRDRQLGVRIAELALLSLEECDEVFGDRIHDLRALGWAWLGNAHRLALDFPSAYAAFNESRDHSARATASYEPLVAAEIKFLMGTFRMCQRDFGAALELIDRSSDLFGIADDFEGQVRALTQRAAICGYAGAPKESIVALQRAIGILEDREDPYLDFMVWGNMANAQARAGLFSAASESLERARESHASLRQCAGALELKWFEAFIEDGLGNFESSESLYVDARTGFAEAKEPGCFCLVSLDLAVLFAKQGEWLKVLPAASGTIPILATLQLHEETLAVVGLLEQAAKRQELTDTLLQEVRDCLQRDPLTRVAKSEDRFSFPVL